MKIINRPRQTGKTTMLIYTAHTTDIPIVTTSSHRVQFIFDQAEKLGIKGIKVFSFAEWQQLNRGSAIGMNGVLIDEAGDFIKDALEEYFKSKIVACTVTFPMEEIPKKPEPEEGEKDKEYGSWEFFYKKMLPKTVFKCENCGTQLIVPE